MNAFTIFGICVIVAMAAFPFVLSQWPTDDNRRRKAQKLERYFTDGRPQGCTCPPNPGLPCDNRHIGSKRCKLTPPPASAEDIVVLTKRVDDLTLALSLLEEGRQSGGH